MARYAKELDPQERAELRAKYGIDEKRIVAAAAHVEQLEDLARHENQMQVRESGCEFS